MAHIHRVVSEYKLPDNAQSNIKVYVRARPLEDRAIPGDFISTGSEDVRQISIKDPDTSNRKYSEVSFQFDHIFWTDVGQEEIFNSMCKPQVDHVIEGFNTCCFAYGQTGSGKTYSMFGNDNVARGIIPRSAEYLFQSLAKKGNTVETAVVCSFLEIYNDQIRDLGKAYLVSSGAETSTSTAIFNKTSDIFESLAGKRGNPYFASAFHSSGGAPKGGGTAESAPGARGLGYKEVQDEYETMNYEIHEDGEGNVFVKNLSMVPVTRIEDVMDMVDCGLKVRATHETKMNASSSRSHTVLTLSVLQRDKITGVSISGMLNLVDLAGSERLKKSESQGIRLKEVLHINTSLSALGKVVKSLDPSAESTHTPYRDAKLTRVLQNSLGGNSYTIVLAAIHPCAAYYEECLSTLQFANRCRNVQNNPRVNYVDDANDKDMKLKKLQEELNVLRTKVVQYERNVEGSNTGRRSMLSAVNIAEVLKKLGVSASVSLDRGSLLINGEKFDFDDIEFDSYNDQGTFFGSEHGGDDNRANRGIGSGIAGQDNYQKMYLELLEKSKSYSNKSKANKLLLQESGIRVQDLSKQLVKLQNIIKRHDQSMIGQMSTLDLRRIDERKALTDLHRHELDQLISHHETAMKKQSIIFQNAPSVFKSQTQIIKMKQNEKDEYEEPLRKEFSDEMSRKDAYQRGEVLILKKQYEHFLKEKDQALEEICEKFSLHQMKKKEQLRMCEEEIIKLFEFAEKMDIIMNNIESGSYKVEQKQGKFGRTANGHFNTGGDGVGVGGSGGTGVRRGSVPDSSAILALTALSAGCSNYVLHNDGNNDNTNDNGITSSYGNSFSNKTNNCNNTYSSSNNNGIELGSRTGTGIGSGVIFGTGIGTGTEVNCLRGRVLLPKGLRPKNPLKTGKSDEMVLSKKIVAKYYQRKNIFDKTQTHLNRKTSTFVEKFSRTSRENQKLLIDDDDENENENGNDEVIDPYVEKHLMELLGPKSKMAILMESDAKIPGELECTKDTRSSSSSNVMGWSGDESQEKDVIAFNTAIGVGVEGRSRIGTGSYRPSSAPAMPMPLSIRKQHDKFYGIDYRGTEEEEEKEEEVHANPTSAPHTARTSRTYSTSSVRDPAFGFIRGASSISASPFTRQVPWGAERKKGNGHGHGQGQGIFDSSGSTRFFNSSGNPKLNSLSSTGAAFSDYGSLEDFASLKKELSELKSQIKVDQHIISGISSNELIQYIQKLEEENQNLHTKVRELYAELRAVKIANDCMMKSQNNRSTKNCKTPLQN